MINKSNIFKNIMKEPLLVVLFGLSIVIMGLGIAYAVAEPVIILNESLSITDSITAVKNP